MIKRVVCFICTKNLWPIKKQMQNHTLSTIDSLWVTINALHVKRSLEERLKKFRKLNNRYFERYIFKKNFKPWVELYVSGG